MKIWKANQITVHLSLVLCILTSCASTNRTASKARIKNLNDPVVEILEDTNVLLKRFDEIARSEDNLLTNATFDDGKDGWQSRNGFHVSEGFISIPYRGLYFIDNIRQTVDLAEKGDYFRIGGCMKGNTDSFAGIQLQMDLQKKIGDAYSGVRIESAYQFEGKIIMKVPTNQWKCSYGFFKKPEETDEVIIRIGLLKTVDPQSGSNGYVDNIFIEPADDTPFVNLDFREGLYGWSMGDWSLKTTSNIVFRFERKRREELKFIHYNTMDFGINDPRISQIAMLSGNHKYRISSCLKAKSELKYSKVFFHLKKRNSQNPSSKPSNLNISHFATGSSEGRFHVPLDDHWRCWSGTFQIDSPPNEKIFVEMGVDTDHGFSGEISLGRIKIQKESELGQLLTLDVEAVESAHDEYRRRRMKRSNESEEDSLKYQVTWNSNLERISQEFVSSCDYYPFMDDNRIASYQFASYFGKNALNNYLKLHEDRSIRPSGRIDVPFLFNAHFNDSKLGYLTSSQSGHWYSAFGYWNVVDEIKRGDYPLIMGCAAADCSEYVDPDPSCEVSRYCYDAKKMPIVAACHYAPAVDRSEVDIDAVWIAQTHLWRIDKKFDIKLIENRDALLKVDINSLATPEVRVVVTNNVGEIWDETLDFPQNQPSPVSNDADLRVDQHRFEESYLGMIPSTIVKGSLSIKLFLDGILKKEINGIQVGAPNELPFRMADIHFFNGGKPSYFDESFIKEYGAKLPVSNLIVRYIHGVRLPILPRAYTKDSEFKIGQFRSQDQAVFETGVNFDGETGITQGINGALQIANGMEFRQFSAAGFTGYRQGQNGAGSGDFGFKATFQIVGRNFRTGGGIIFHEIAHGLRLLHGGNLGSNWAYVPPLNLGADYSIPEFTYGDKSYGTPVPLAYVKENGELGDRKSVLGGGGGGAHVIDGFWTGVLSAFQIQKSQEWLEKRFIRWNEDYQSTCGSDNPIEDDFKWFKWCPEEKQYSKPIGKSNIYRLPESPDLMPVSTILVMYSRLDNQFGRAYPPIGPYNGGYIDFPKSDKYEEIKDDYCEKPKGKHKIAEGDYFKCPWRVTYETDKKDRNQNNISATVLLARPKWEKNGNTDEPFYWSAINVPQDQGNIVKIALKIELDGVEMIIHNWKKDKRHDVRNYSNGGCDTELFQLGATSSCATDYCEENKTFEEALNFCQDQGLRLCHVNEIHSGIIPQEGACVDKLHWTTIPCHEANVRGYWVEKGEKIRKKEGRIFVNTRDAIGGVCADPGNQNNKYATTCCADAWAPFFSDKL